VHPASRIFGEPLRKAGRQERESVLAPGLNAFDLEGWLGEIQDQSVVLSGGTQV